jgi:fibronectin type 3 domain-containing protein
MSAKHFVVGTIVIAGMLALGWRIHGSATSNQRSSATSQARRVILKWDKTAEAVSYNIYRRPYSGATFTKLGSSDTASYIDTAVQPELRYCYQVTSVDSKGRESKPSQEFCVTIPQK